ncbi:MAG: type I DNA topoisomerase, partial [Deltaproteobacteria bacterium]|nr:type I DNA topoisomerase [Deltaproteobacteria bacterium]
IAWHIAEEVDGKRRKVYRVLLHEITKKGVLDAVHNPGRLNRQMFEAQKARRILDRLVGYQISPLLWDKVRRGLSAGRVQSVAVRLVVEREREIRAFVPQEYWTITATLEGGTPPPFQARLLKVQGESVEVPSETVARGIVQALERASFVVQSVEQKERRRNPAPPFITSTLQQEAYRKLRFSVKKTMVLAQRLYEGVDLGEEGAVGLITYMRTDSTRISEEALRESRAYIRARFGEAYLPETPNVYRGRKGALVQDAHEAIRPTSFEHTPDRVRRHLERDQAALYELIWNRFVACQMLPAVYDQASVDIAAGPYLLRATGSVLKFAGYTAVYTEGRDEEGNGEEGTGLPPLTEGERLRLLGLSPEQHFTQPPPRFTEATLVKELEEKGIGRPSTYAAILGTIQEKEYVTLDKGRFAPTDLGFLVNDLLVESFPDVLNVEFTAKMEDDLDKVEEGEVHWVEALREFYGPFSKSLKLAQKKMRNVKAEEIPTEVPCERCGRMMVIKWGKNGQFLACPGYPACKNTKEFTRDASGKVVVQAEEETGDKCELCGSAMVVKRGRYGKFVACSSYPACKNTRPYSLGVECPAEGCGGQIVEKMSRKGRVFYGCSNYPSCTFALWDRPVAEPCPACGAGFLVERVTKTGEHTRRCAARECGYKAAVA